MADDVTGAVETATISSLPVAARRCNFSGHERKPAERAANPRPADEGRPVDSPMAHFWRIIWTIRLISKRLGAGLTGSAAAGLLLAHQLAYIIATPDPHARLEQLSGTGHSYWHLTVAAGIALLVWGCLRHLATLRTEEIHSAKRLFVHSWGFLAVAQMTGFAALETVERLGAHHEFRNVLAEPAVSLGLVLVLLLALIIAALFVVFTKVVAHLLSLPKHRRVAVPARGHPPSSFVATLPPGRGAGTLRGPPISL